MWWLRRWQRRQRRAPAHRRRDPRVLHAEQAQGSSRRALHHPSLLPRRLNHLVASPQVRSRVRLRLRKGGRGPVVTQQFAVVVVVRFGLKPTFFASVRFGFISSDLLGCFVLKLWPRNKKIHKNRASLAQRSPVRSRNHRPRIFFSGRFPKRYCRAKARCNSISCTFFSLVRWFLFLSWRAMCRLRR